MIGRRSQKDAQLPQVEQDFTAVTLTAYWLEFLGISIQGSVLKHTAKASPLCPLLPLAYKRSPSSYNPGPQTISS